MPYNEFCVPQSKDHAVSICTYFESRQSIPENIRLYAGDNTIWGFFRSLKAARRKRDYDVIHVHAPHVGVLLIIAGLFHSGLGSAVYTVHNSYHSYKLRNKLLLIPIFAFFPLIVHCSRASHQSFPRLYKILCGNRWQVIQNGLDLTRVDQTVDRVSKNSHNDEFGVVSVGRLIDIKNPSVLLRAFHQSDDQNSHLMLIGDGYLKESLIEEFNTWEAGGKVNFVGLVSRETVFRFLNQANLFLSTSKGEGLPVAVLEAMACRRPVVLSDIPPHREIATGVDFIPLLEPDDTDGFAREIEKFRQMLPRQRAAIGEACRRHVEEHFSQATMHEKYIQVYLEVA